jgi:hypothetical protein
LVERPADRFLLDPFQVLVQPQRRQPALARSMAPTSEIDAGVSSVRWPAPRALDRFSELADVAGQS